LPPLLFALVIFWIGSHIFAQAGLDWDSSISATQIAGFTDMRHLVHFSDFYSKVNFSLKVMGNTHSLLPPRSPNALYSLPIHHSIML
jgi:hypothetical protein